MVLKHEAFGTEWSCPRGSERNLDLGSGTGTLAVMLKVASPETRPVIERRLPLVASSESQGSTTAIIVSPVARVAFSPTWHRL